MQTKAKQRAGNVIRAQGVAAKLLELYGFQRPSEIHLDALMVDRGLDVKRGGLRGCEARLVRIGNHGIVRIRELEIGAPRSRFTLSHELGHWELHVETQAFICTSANLRDYRNDQKEAEANTFASELLMPTHMIRPIVAINDPAITTAQSVAEQFNVSLTAAAIRILLESHHECFLAVSKNRRVQWWMSGSDRFGLWLESNQPLSEETVAYHLTDGTAAPGAPEVVPTESWFLHLPSPDRVELSEDSVRLGSTGFVLSILVLADSD